MLNSIFGYLFLFIGILTLVLPLILVELSRPKDWLVGSLFLFLGLFLFVENDFLRDSINLFVVSLSILFGLMMSEIIQSRWFQLSVEEQNRIGSFARWFESFQQLGKIFTLIGSKLFDFFKSFSIQSQKTIKEKKWIRSELKEEIKKKVGEQSSSTDPNKIRNQELTENEETS